MSISTAIKALLARGVTDENVPATGSVMGTPRFWEKPIKQDADIDPASIAVFSASQFPPESEPAPWLDRDDAPAVIDELARAGTLTGIEAALCRQWHEEGYVILRSFYNDEELNAGWNQYENYIDSGKVIPPVDPFFEGDELPGRVLDVHFQVPALDRMLFEPRINKIISILLGAKARPFQTIVGHKSSQQLEHSDSIHMTTYPRGYLAATWIAYEDVDLGAGPLNYYPGSHRLPYILADEAGIDRGGHGYDQYHTKYEPAIQREIEYHNLRASYFIPKKGDVLIWHANLLHGGSKVLTQGRSRKALVCHYFAEGCVCYHDLTGASSRLHNDKNHYQYDRDDIA